MANVVDLVARRDAAEAKREAQEATRSVGALVRDESKTAGKVDDLITQQRRTNATLDMLVRAVRDLRVGHEQRRKLESFADLDPEVLSAVTERERRIARTRHTLRKWGRRAVLALIIGAATVTGATGAAWVLHALHITLPGTVEVSP